MKFSKFTKILIVVWFVALCLILFNFFRFIADYTELEANHSKVLSELWEAKHCLYDLERQVTSSDRKYLGEFTITHYDDCTDCCGKSDGITKSGAKVCEGVTVAVDPSVIPLGTYIYIENIGYRVAQDIGGAVKGNRIDVYVSSHSKAWELGKLDNMKVWRLN